MIDFTGGSPVWYYMHQDALGHVVALSNNSGNLVESYAYTPFGTPTVYDAAGDPIAASAVGNPYRFTGRRYDPESGLYYYRHRMYNPQLGRFMQTDPIGYADGMNMYAYCGNNPVNWIDPWGLYSSGDAAADWAKRNEGNERYYAKYDHWFWGPMNRCNRFVADAYRRGAGVPFPSHDNGIWWKPSLSPASAHELADPDADMPNYPMVDIENGKDCEIEDQLKPGDILSNGHHSGVYIGDGKVAQASSNNPKGVVNTDLTDPTKQLNYNNIQNGKVKVRRYSGPKPGTIDNDPFEGVDCTFP